ncbi:MAG TPA: hypothetical protein VHY59_06905, partial [Chthoniobacterales bacterium]|nr:hypothetical protein [Chthoniobacterales bacterium]
VHPNGELSIHPSRGRADPRERENSTKNEAHDGSLEQLRLPQTEWPFCLVIGCNAFVMIHGSS